TQRGLGEFHRWLTRCVADLDPEAYEAACEEAGEGRYVRFEHQANGMSYLEAYLPTLEAAAIQNRLRAAARGLDSPPAHDDEDPHAGGDVTSGGDSRSLVQRQVDLLAAWLRDGRVYQTPVEAKIMVMIPEATLAGVSDEPGVAADRSWRIPAGQARALATDPGAQHQWYQGRVRRNLKEADYDLLSARYVGRFPPARLRDALVFRDGTCQAPGCTVAAQCCDIDHQHPWEAGGETTASNLWALCRRHHRMKSHGHLTPPTPEDKHKAHPPKRAGPAQPPPGNRHPDRGQHRSPSRHHRHPPAIERV
ncbi:HNH endonuclease signature motif containing protein, partial [Nesterenkonia haasae]|uniref:HNH endonuclease signature motif containing protein n=1 Tax=Nesterenkonia haasae TaxID=2587813 RepID=UPI001391EAC3